MPKPDVIVGLDVGTTKVAVTVGQVREGLIHLIGIGKAPNSGMRRGMVVDIEETVSAISAALEEAERTAGLPLSSAYVGINGSHLETVNSKGVIAVSRADGEITSTDVERVLEAARAIALPPNHEILHVIPKSFIVDGQENIKDPLGMNGIRLEAEAYVIGGAVSAIKNLTKCVFQAGLEINGLIFAPLATSRGLLSKKQKEIGVLMVDLGAGTCGLVAFEEGEVILCNVLPVGAMHITNDIAIGLRTSIESAEKIKIKYGSTMPDNIRETEKIDLSQFEANETEKPSRQYLAQIIEARLSEIFNLIRDELKKVGKEGMLPAGVVLTGGGAKLEDLVEAAKISLRLPCQIGYPMLEMEGLIDKVEDPIYATSIGLLLWGLEENQHQSSRLQIPTKHIGGAINKVRNILKQFLP